ncbi:uncharacterized protein BT62DRAFT_989911 [Guyanagaster necrorhizus]|uniref:Uncharacterized protein n=1 Tax=Guyanagaster necrorhizus TaxID=856835 RepID=A0A9P8AYG9_9AGAR|nr:uncharacterized protein BT62DRAFT_989911 [Guyanagaster necrorhizus MCA 3950]KAG7452884.1 hypothetical protein BT62DRAFT_989911 [Guyanagaster necrorhizus MCA 3950]
MDFVQGLDLSKLLLGGAVLSFAVSAFSAPFYNFPLFLYGLYGQENTESVSALQNFTCFLAGSLLWDIIWMANHEQNGFIKFLSILLLVLKIPTFGACGLAVRQRGATFGGLGLRGSDLSGPTVWSMPGGFTSTGRDDYQNLDEEATVSAPPRVPVAAPHRPSNPAPPPPPATGPYQTA